MTVLNFLSLSPLLLSEGFAFSSISTTSDYRGSHHGSYSSSKGCMDDSCHTHASFLRTTSSSKVTLAHASSSSLSSSFSTSSSSLASTEATSAVQSSPQSSSSALSSTWDNDAWLSCFKTTQAEDHYELNAGSGTIPADLDGTVYNVGPAKFDVNGKVMGNPFIGDGMVTAVTFKDGRAHFRNSFIKTKGYQKEEQEGKVVYSTKPVSWEAGWAAQYALRDKNTANQGILYWGKRLYVFWGKNLPWKIDPKNLETFFQDDVRLQLKDMKSGGEPFGPRPVYDAVKNRMAVASYAGGGKVSVREFNDKFLCARPIEQQLPGGVSASILPAFGMTQRYFVFVVPSVKIDQFGLVTGLKTLDQALTQDSTSSSIVLMPRIGTKGADQKPVVVPVDASICAGVVNAYDDDVTGDVVLDMVRADPLSLGTGGSNNKPMTLSNINSKVGAWEGLDYRTQVPKKELTRYVIHPRTKTSEKRLSLCSHHSHDTGLVNPLVSGAAHRYVWVAVGKDLTAASPIQGVMKIDTTADITADHRPHYDAWFPEPHEFIGALSFANKKTTTEGGEGEGKEKPEEVQRAANKEDDGYIIGTLLNGKDLTSQVVIFDASNIAKGPICKLNVKTNLPPSNYAYYAAGLSWDPDTIEKSFRLVGLFKRKGWNVAKSDFSGLGLGNLLEE